MKDNSLASELAEQVNRDVKKAGGNATCYLFGASSILSNIGKVFLD